jgi:hypothetical protein
VAGIKGQERLDPVQAVDIAQHAATSDGELVHKHATAHRGARAGAAVRESDEQVVSLRRGPGDDGVLRPVGAVGAREEACLCGGGIDGETLGRGDVRPHG